MDQGYQLLATMICMYLTQVSKLIEIITRKEKLEWNQIEGHDFNQMKPRAGHSMTVYDRYLIIIGGSYAQAYFKELYVIDTGI